MRLSDNVVRRGLIGILGVAGSLHFIKPDPFDEIVPAWVPGTDRQIIYISGVAELFIAGLLACPVERHRKLAGLLATALFVAVFPANIEMTRQFFANDETLTKKIISVVRLPLQIPLILGGLRVFKDNK